LNKTMELFHDGQLKQSELLAICQTISNLHQQLSLTQNELKVVQSQGAAVPQSAQSPTMPPSPVQNTPPPGILLAEGRTEDLPATPYAPPPPNFHGYADTTIPLAPPPPSSFVGGSAPFNMADRETLLAPPPGDEPMPPASDEKLICRFCNGNLTPEIAFCPNCGAPTAGRSIHLPTVRATSEIHIADLPTRRAAPDESRLGDDNATMRADAPLPYHPKDGSN
jgi:hypothetical protein